VSVHTRRRSAIGTDDRHEERPTDEPSVGLADALFVFGPSKERTDEQSGRDDGA
jgi:hypothetical protein